MKSLFSQLNSRDKNYYLYLTHQSFFEYSQAENNFKIYQYPSAASSLFRSIEFFWKALISLSGKPFEQRHEATRQEIKKISNALLSMEEKSRVWASISGFSEQKRQLATYGYYEAGSGGVSPYSEFSKSDIQADMEKAEYVINLLRKIHLAQVLTPIINVGILSGYIEGSKDEVACSNFTYSNFKSELSLWLKDLKQITDDDGVKLFNPTLINLNQLQTGLIPIVINPFGETIPHIKNNIGMGFNAILEYIRNGGIFINAAGHPFIYGWNVDSGNVGVIVPTIPTIRGVKVESNGKLRLWKGQTWLTEKLLLTENFEVRVIWDMAGRSGPQEVNVQYEKCLGDRKVAAFVFRPIRDLTSKVIPLVSSDNEIWGKVYPIVAIQFGRGFLIHVGLTLDGEREYNILLDVIRRIGMRGSKILSGDFTKQRN